MNIKYKLMAKFKTGDVAPDIREVENRINKIVKEGGFPEFFLQTTGKIAEIETKRVLDNKEKSDILDAFNKEFKEKGLSVVCTDLEIE